jgi:predicted nucleic acid-binding protein
VNEVCVDASLIVKLALKGEAHRAKARKFVKDCGANGTILIAPPIFENELDSIIRRRVFEGKLTPDQAQLTYRVLDGIPVQIITHSSLRKGARGIAEQFNQRLVYDSTYAALAELRRCDFWTADKAFYDSVKVALPFVKYLLNYQ